MAPPALTISWYPRGFPGFGSVVLPSSPEWRAYLRAAADAGLPPSCGPNGHLGSWDVRVEDPEAEAALASVLRAHDLSWRPVDHAASLRCFRLDRFEKVRAALTETFADWILPPRDTMEPAAPTNPPSGARNASAAASTPPTADLFAQADDLVAPVEAQPQPDTQTSLF